MKTATLLLPLCCALLLLPAGAIADITGFRAVEVKNECTIDPGNGTYSPLEQGKTYSFGSTVKTGRNSSLVMELSEGNTFQLLARTTLKIDKDVRDAKLKRLNMKIEEGTISLNLDDFPKDHKLEVETPTAVCGAVGTRFVVSFDQEDNNRQEPKSRFDCDKGEVYVSSRFRVGDNDVDAQGFDAPSVKAGGSIVATIHEGLENSYSDITVNRGSIEFEVGGDGKKSSRFTASPEEGKSARFVCSIEKSAKDVDMVAVKVRDGEIVNTEQKMFGKTEVTSITPQDGAVVIYNQEVKKPTAGDTIVEEYIVASQQEGIKSTELGQLKRIETPSAAQQAQIKTVEMELAAAAAKATKLRNDLLRKRMSTFTRHVRQATQRMNLPRRRP